MKKKFKINKIFRNNLFNYIKKRITFNYNKIVTYNYLKHKKCLFVNKFHN